MIRSGTTASPVEEFRRVHRGTVVRLHAQAKADRWGLSEAEFAAALSRSATSRLPSGGQPAEPERVESYLGSLYVEDLALATACKRGNAAAWTDFVTRFRPVLHAAARKLTRDEGRAKEIADSLYAELYGLAQEDGWRKGLLDHFHGRSSLATWLHAVVVRACIDDYRALRRRSEVTEKIAAEPSAAPEASAAPDPDRAASVRSVRSALALALGRLEPRDRLRLSYYHLQGLTLLQIGRILGEHESTVSRNLDRTRRTIRKQVESSLRQDYGFSSEDVQSCCEYALEDWPFELERTS